MIRRFMIFFAVTLPSLAATTQPITQSTFDVLESSVPVGTAIHVNAWSCFTPPTDAFDHCLSWNFGRNTIVADPTKYATGATRDLGLAFPGPVAAHVYSQPGTYTITLTDRLRNPDGSAGEIERTLSRAVTVTAANRKVIYIDGQLGDDSNAGTDATHPIKTADHAAQLLTDNTELRFRNGQQFLLSGCLSLQHENVVIGGYGDAASPVIRKTAAGNMFSCWPGQTCDVTLTGLSLDSAWTLAFTENDQGQPQIAYHQPIAALGIMRGTNVMLVDCQFGNLQQGPQGASNLDGLYVLRCTQTQAWGIPSRCVWLEGSDLVVAGCTFLNSVNESPLRMDSGAAGSTGANRVAIVANRVGQLLNAAHNRSTTKAAMTLRYGSMIHVEGNLFVDAESSFNSPGWPNVVTTLDVRNNVIFGLTSADGYLHIRDGVFDAAVQDNKSWQQTVDYWISPSDSDVRLDSDQLTFRNNWGCAWLGNARLVQIDSYQPPALSTFNHDAMQQFVRATTQPIAVPATMPSN